jgi:hypothetical protein
MQDKQNKLLIDMVLKIDEARTYHRISGLLTLIWLFEICYVFFWLSYIDLFYWLIWGVCLVGWVHMDRKYKVAMNEYDELKQEYENTI